MIARAIRVLPQELASQIAAGEVIERPSSVVKELVENSLDAGARRCDVSIEGGGVTRIAITDDGHGMTEQDARRCVERHATSKLERAEELFELSSFGFRGEALPSIASVSRFRLSTRSASSDSAIAVRVEAGSAAELEPTGHAVGTTVEVTDLFFNVPARRKFLRSSNTESGHIADAVDNAALSNPETTFTLTRDGRKVREWLRVTDRESRVRQLSSGPELFACRGERGPLRLEAFLSRPEQARAGSAGLKIFVNNRPVRDRAIAATVAHAYGSVLERGRYPRGVVYVDVVPRLVDINVHPQKAEVRFADPRAVTDAVYGILSRKLAQAFSTPASRLESPSRAAEALSAAPAAESDPAFTPPDRAFPRELRTGSADTAHAEVDLAVHDSGRSEERPGWSGLVFLAQARQTYLICEGSDGLYIIDQHAAAERVTFSKLRQQYLSQTIASQTLLFPDTVELDAHEIDLVRQYAENIKAVGFELEPRGTGFVSIHAVPKLLNRASPERLLRDLLGEVSRSSERAFSDAVDKALATMACHASTRAGDPLSPAEARALLGALDDADFAGHCPHGRPIVALMSYNELERKVGRR